MLEDKKRAKAIFEEAFLLTNDLKKAYSEREMEILLSLGVTEFSEKNYHEALEFFNKVKIGLQNPEQLNDKAIKTRFLYNNARVLTRLGKYDESIQHCKEAIRWCINQENMYALGAFTLPYRIQL